MGNAYLSIGLLFVIGVAPPSLATEMAVVDNDLEVGRRAVPLAFELTTTTNDAGESIVRSDTDYHVVADVPIDAMAMVFLNRDRIADYMPNLHEYEWTPVTTETGDVVVEVQRIGVRFMGIDATYHIRQRSEVIDLRMQEPRRFIVEYEMTDSLDGKLASSRGTFFLEETEVDGRFVTYMRQRNATEFRDPFPGFSRILRAFAPGGTRRLFRSMIDEAERYTDR